MLVVKSYAGGGKSSLKVLEIFSEITGASDLESILKLMVVPPVAYSSVRVSVFPDYKTCPLKLLSLFAPSDWVWH